MSSDGTPDTAAIFPPVFATNRPGRGETVAAEVNRLLAGKRRSLRVAPEIAIATAYLNPAGVVLLLDELELARRVRLLLGAEPDPAASQPRSRQLSREELQNALRRHEAWLAAERDLTGFNREADGAARRMVDWLQARDDSGERRVEVRRYTEGFLHGKAFLVDQEYQRAVLAGSSNLTYAGLMTNAELNLGYPDGHHAHLVQDWFQEFWLRSTDFPLDELYASRWDEHSPWLIFLRMLWELYGRDLGPADEAAATDELRLTGFQRDGVQRLLRLLEANGGVLVADEVGLGKTFMAGEVIRRAVEERRQRVLVLAPAALKEAMWEPFLEEYAFSRRVQAMSYDELRLSWQRDHAEVRRKLDDYAVVVVDEAHNLRNPQAQRTETVAALVGGAHPKQVILLTATPVNNSLGDLHALVSLFIRNDAFFADAGIPSIRKYVAEAAQLDPESLSPEHLFDLLDRVAVRRTRRFVREHYTNDRIPGPDGTEQTIRFPTPRLHRLDYELDAVGDALLTAVIRALEEPDEGDFRASDPERLILARYIPDAYRLGPARERQYQFANAGLLRSALLKCLESSPAALLSTLNTLIRSHEAFLSALQGGWVLVGDALKDWVASDAEDLESHLERLNEQSQSGAAPAADYRIEDLTADVAADLLLLGHLKALATAAADKETDPKADQLIGRLREIASQARTTSPHGLSGADRRKTIVFSSFVATVQDLQRRVQLAIDTAADDDSLSDYRKRLPAHPIHGSKTGVDQQNRARVIAGFAPETAGGHYSDNLYDLLFTTDVLSEGVNLQQAGRIVNYDLPWNPMRVVQRHGRIDRIGSPHRRIVLDCFFPASRLEELLDLEQRLHRKLAMADAAVGTGPVLPGFDAGEGQVFSDSRRQIMELHAEDTGILDRGGQHRALSGEEYRHRLRRAIQPGADRAGILALPFASGSGFVNSACNQSGYVFCIRVGHCLRGGTNGSVRTGGGQACRETDCEVCRRDPHFRFVPVDEEWQPLRNAEGEPVIVAETLQALIAADPLDEATERELSRETYEGAFDAWEIARRHVWERWMRLTDPANLQPDVPKAFRDASELLHRHGAEVLGVNELARLIACFNTVPSARVQREVRGALNADEPRMAQVARLRDLAKNLGLRPPEPVRPLPAVDKEEVHLIAWMAVKAGRVAA